MNAAFQFQLLQHRIHVHIDGPLQDRDAANAQFAQRIAEGLGLKGQAALTR